MKKRVFIATVLILLLASALFAKTERPERPWDLSAEISAMLTVQLDIEYFFTDSIGLKAGFGISPFGLTCFSYNALVVYHLNLPAEHFQLDIEAGLPLGYFDFLEGRYVDWDPMIDDPYHGYLTGGGLLASYRFNEDHALGLRAGAAAMFEHQQDTGWRRPRVIPVIALVYNF